MRTTVTLDPDVAIKLKAFARQRGISFRQALNSAVRAGLGAERRALSRVQAVRAAHESPSGLGPGQALYLAGTLEDEEIFRRLERRK